MKSTSLSRPVCFVLAITLSAAAPFAIGDAAEVKLPVIHGETTLATVNGEPITLEQYGKQFGSIHAGATGKDQVRKKDPAELLERMIKVKLVVQEAENMGMDGLPDVQQAIANFQQEALRNFLFGEHVRTINKADPKETDKIYKDLVKEIKPASVRFDKEEDANSFQSAVKAGGDFGVLAARAIEEGKAKGSGKGTYIKPADVPPEMAGILSGMKSGEVSPVIKVGNKFTILKVDAIRFPEDKEKRKEAAKLALQRKRSASLKIFTSSLEKKHAKYDNVLIKAMDFEAESPGFEKLLQDERPVAWIKGEDPVTVKDWAESLNKIFFHGIDQAIKQKRVNSKKDQSLEQIVTRKVLFKEAKRRKIDQSAAYKGMVMDFRNELLFGAFVQKVVDPESRGSDEELKAYLQEHIADYTVPEAIRLELLVFTTKEDAEEAIGKLRAGADFQWMRANATGQADPSAVKEMTDFKGKLVSKAELPDGLKQAVAGAATGDLRLHTGPEGLSYVVVVQEVVPPRPEEYESVKDRVAKRVFDEKRGKVLETWMDKLKKASKVVVYAKGEQLRRLLETDARPVKKHTRETPR